MVFKQQYSDEKILESISPDIQRNAASIAKLAGCSIYTVKRALDRLELTERIRRVTIETGGEDARYAWLKIEKKKLELNI